MNNHPFLRYKYKNGMIAWALQRLSGLCLAFYLVAHLLVTSLLIKGPASFDKMMEMLHSPITVALEICLIGVVMYHALNGIRLALLSFGVPTKYHSALFWILMFIGVVLFALSWYVIFPWDAIGF
ncbi:MAG: succinate dehydrogenase, cytochrome b556 subunit [Armatimonadota bacterium]